MAEILRALRAVLVGLALRLPISWVNILVGPAVTIDGRTLDTRVQWFLKLLKWMDAEPVYTRTVDEVRETMDGVVPLLRGRAPPVGQIIDRTIVGGLRVRIYRPAGSVARLLPTILYFHGGGWVTGSLEGFDLACRYFCARSGCVVISVDYRLAPESKFPAAIEDARTAFDWVLA
ncbi:MAG TPA: alpha/beta hydrolase, partial [Reyranellaceae bacterium]|nr:alpha/beta hydrolase [Reyranellaceae bacterium]